MIQADICKLLDSEELGYRVKSTGLFKRFNETLTERERVLEFLESIETAERFSVDTVEFNDRMSFFGTIGEMEKHDAAWLHVHRSPAEFISNFKILLTRSKGEEVWDIHGLDMPTFDGYLRKCTMKLPADKVFNRTGPTPAEGEENYPFQIKSYYVNEGSKDVGDDIEFTTASELATTLKLWYHASAVLTVSPATLKWLTDFMNFMTKLPYFQPIGNDNLAERLK